MSTTSGGNRGIWEALHGNAWLPEDEEYDQARAIYQGRAQNAGPAMIVVCADDHDVILAMRHARDHGLSVAVRGGGHGSDGYAMAPGSLVIDLSKMREITVDRQKSTISAQAGVVLGELDAAAQEHGLVVPAGTVSSTGIAGLTLGGGIGHLMRRFGATVDNVVGFDMITVEGEKVRAEAHENEELFWALRGGGGNFGVVTRFEYQAHPFGPDVVAGQLIFPLDQAQQVLEGLVTVAASAPRELGLLAAIAPAPSLPSIPEAAQGHPVVILVPVWSGQADQAQNPLAALRALGEPVLDLVRRMPWTQANSMLDAVAPYGMRMNLRGGYLPSLDPEPVSALLEHAQAAPQSSDSTSVINLWCMGGAISEDTPEEETAFSRQGAAWLWEAVSMWRDPDVDRHHASEADALSARMAPYSLTNGYSNLSDDLGASWREGLHGSPDKHARLRAVKAAWDPHNVLRHNKNITPSTSAPWGPSAD